MFNPAQLERKTPALITVGLCLLLRLALANAAPADGACDPKQGSCAASSGAQPQASAQPPAGQPISVKISLSWQATVIGQGHSSFNSPYEGPRSLRGHGEEATTKSATFFLGIKIDENTEIYLDAEDGGGGISDAFGLGAFPNAEVARTGGAQAPRIARGYVAQTIPLGGEMEEIPADLNQIAGSKPRNRVTVILGKFSLNDFFDGNSYAHDPRTQFINWCLMDGCAFDWASDSFAYDEGIVAELKLGDWALRGAFVLEPKAMNGAELDYDLGKARSVNVEIQKAYQLAEQAGKVRILVFENRAHMAMYNEAIQQLELAGPQAQPVLGSGNPTKKGIGANLEQAIGPEAGVFARAYVADGRMQNWTFTEADESLAGGASIKGNVWGRPDDVVGIGAGVNGLSAAHAQYLNAGGLGIMLGDGKIHYGPEQFIEAYYAFKLPFIAGATLSPDIQYFKNPGYNRDRGPAWVYSVRFHYQGAIVNPRLISLGKDQPTCLGNGDGRAHGALGDPCVSR